MKQITFPLKAKMKGPKVANLQNALLWLLENNRILPDEESSQRKYATALKEDQTKQYYGAATRKLVALFQTSRQLQATGEVDEATATALNTLLETDREGGRDTEEPDEFIVQGEVRFDDGVPAPGLTVHAFDRDMRSKELLGKGQTDRNGAYEIHYSSQSFRRTEKDRADLVVQVLNSGKEVATSDIVFNAEPAQAIDLTLDRKQYGGPSQYERYLKELAPLIGNIPVAELTEQDIEFLNRESGIAAERLRFLQLDAAWSNERGIQQSVFYGLLRQGLPSTYWRLMAEKPLRLETALKASLAENIIPQGIGDALEEILARLEDLAVDVASRHEDPATPAPPGTLLATSKVEPEQQGKLIRFALRYQGDSTKFWETAQQTLGLDGKVIDEARFALDAGGLVGRHLPTLSTVQQLKESKGWTHVRDLAKISRKEWKEIVESSTTNGMPQGFEKPNEFAEAIAYGIEEIMPTAVFAHRVSGAQIGSADLDTFLGQNADFDIVHTNVDDYFINGVNLDGVGDPKKVRDQVKAFQRITRVVPRKQFYETTEGLVGAGFNSAVAIKAKGKRRFLEETAQFVNPEVAAEIYEHAHRRASTADIVFERARDHMESRSPVLPGGSAADVESEPDGIPAWAKLFGDISGCACEHCRSVYGPAAYFADLLKFLDDAPSNTVFNELRNRRPDLEHIVLNCANATTPLPHIDLVNEILGDAVNGSSTSARQTTWDGERLRAEPEHKPDGAYGTLTAGFPWTLPFAPDHEEAQLFAEHLGVDLAALWRAFGRAPDDITRATLGLSEAAWSLLTVAPADDAVRSAQWGGSSLADLTSATTFMEKSGLSYTELEALCESRFLSTEGAGEVSLSRDADPCDISDDTLIGLTGDLLDQIQRFIRLSRHLGWPVAAGNIPLDTALAALGHGAVDAAALSNLSRAIRLANVARRPVADFLNLSALQLAQALRTTEDELLLFAQTVGANLSSGTGTLDLVDDWEVLSESRLTPRQLAYILLGWDQAPGTFAPREAEVDDLLDELHSIVQINIDSATDSELDVILFDNIGRYLSVEPDLVEELVSTLSAPSDPALSVIEDARAWARAADGTGVGHVRQLVFGLHRMTTLTTALGLGAREVAAVAVTRGDNDFLDFNALTRIDFPLEPADAALRFAAWGRLAQACRLRGYLPRGDQDLFDFLGRAANPGLDSAALADATGWPATDIDLLAGAPPNFLQVATYARLQLAMSWIRRLDVTASKIASWASAMSIGSIASELRTTARDRYADDNAWYAVLAPVSDALREKTRDALLAYLLQNPASPEDFANADEVYAHYLIDVEMSSCQLTSRIVQANAAIQLFVQRLRMNLEEVRLNNADSEYWKQWAWRKNYRVWEANRKVFLYPENWLEPELRDTKTPFFRALENELLQDEITDTAAERAYRNYLARLDEVANLDVRAFYQGVEEGILHVVARTHSSPHTYFYRRRLASSTWEPWEKVDLQIEGDHVVPVVHNSHLMLFWPTFHESQERGAGEGDHPIFEMYLNWSERRDGAWAAAKKSTRALKTGNFHGKRYYLRAEAENTSVFSIECFEGHNLYNDAIYWRSLIGRFYIQECEGSMNIEQIASGSSLLLEVPNTILLASQFEEVLRSDLPLIVNRFDDYASGPSTLLHSPEEGHYEDFFVLPPHQDERFYTGLPFFFVEEGNSFLVRPETGEARSIPESDVSGATGMDPDVLFRISGGLVGTSGGSSGRVLRWHSFYFEIFYHPHSCKFIEILERRGVPGLLMPPASSSLDRQLTPSAEEPLGYYTIGFGVKEPMPTEVIDFSQSGAYSIYNWEIFLHIPLLIASRLSKNQRFEEAQKWFHYIFDPTDVSDHPAPAKYWRVKPLYQEALDPPESIHDLMRRLAADMNDDDVEAQIETWESDPFDPHAIARLRPQAYMKAVVMKYLDNLIAWGDSLFRQNTRESINEAAQIYLLAAEILGERLNTISREDPGTRDFAALRSEFDEFANAIVDFESGLPANLPRGGGDVALPPDNILYFCIPTNKKLREYHDTVGDRLFKIRHCMNIAGERQSLPLFAPPIDPALLVRARAMGLDLRQVLAQLGSVSLPSYRYSTVYQKAKELTGDVRALGNALLSAFEKKDSESLALIRARHESTLLDKVREIKDQRVQEASEEIAALEASKTTADERRMYYEGREFRNASERAHIGHLHDAHAFEITQQGVSLAASIAHLIPQFHAQAMASGTSFGGVQIGQALSATAETFGIIASQYTFEANMASFLGSHQRRQDDWNFQGEQATSQVAEIDKKILAATIRRAVAENELNNHDTQIEQARETEQFLRSKFTGEELYGWMSSQLAALYHDAYRMAYEVAMKAERAAQHQLGLEPASFQFIRFGHWDSLKKGLLAGEKLHQELARMDLAYMEQNLREFELTKHVSLSVLDPSQIMRLRELGECEFELPEVLFDLDFPGHYYRRIKSVSLTIPCVTGPYTNVSATLRLDRSRWRRNARLGESAEFVDEFGGTTSIATSHAQADRGLFEFSFRDERYLPFEGAGAISRWRLELPSSVRSFDYDTISDVVMQVQYTARDGGDAFRNDVNDQITTAIDEWVGDLASTRTPLTSIVSMRQTFSSEFHQFLHPRAEEHDHLGVMSINGKHLPFFLKQHLEQEMLSLQDTQVVLKPNRAQERSDYDGRDIEFGKEGDISPEPLKVDGTETDPSWGGLPYAEFPGLSGSPLGNWNLRMDPTGLPNALTEEIDGRLRLRADAIEDIFLVFQYQVTGAS